MWPLEVALAEKEQDGFEKAKEFRIVRGMTWMGKTRSQKNEFLPTFGIQRQGVNASEGDLWEHQSLSVAEQTSDEVSTANACKETCVPDVRTRPATSPLRL